MAATLKTALLNNLLELQKLSAGDRLKMRYQKYRAYGQYLERKETVSVAEIPQSNGNGSGQPH
jgi:hypothetical protein